MGKASFSCLKNGIKFHAVRERLAVPTMTNMLLGDLALSFSFSIAKAFGYIPKDRPQGQFLYLVTDSFLRLNTIHYSATLTQPSNQDLSTSPSEHFSLFSLKKRKTKHSYRNTCCLLSAFIQSRGSILHLFLQVKNLLCAETLVCLGVCCMIPRVPLI